MRIVVVFVVLLAARSAHATCEYFNDYYEPELPGTCSGETLVPEGCPVHVTTFGEAPRLVVHRGLEILELPTTAALLETPTIELNVVDPFDCDCARTLQRFALHRHAVTVQGLVEGDFVHATASGSTIVTIGPAAPCPAPVWPTDFAIYTRCDRCPGTDDPDDPDRPRTAGCSAGGGSIALVLFGLVGLAGLRRRA